MLRAVVEQDRGVDAGLMAEQRGNKMLKPTCRREVDITRLGFAQRNDVSAPGHGNANGHTLLAPVANLDPWRVGVVAAYVGYVTEPDLVAIGRTYGHGTQVFDGLELPGHAHLHLILRRVLVACFAQLFEKPVDHRASLFCPFELDVQGVQLAVADGAGGVARG